MKLWPAFTVFVVLFWGVHTNQSSYLGELKIENPQISEEEQEKSSPYLEFAKYIKKGTVIHVPIAVLDSGLDMELAAREAIKFQDLAKLNLAPSVEAFSMLDDLSHGTAVSLLLSAPHNGFGMRGLLPQAQVLPIRLASREEFLSGKVPFSRIENAFAVAKSRGVKILNLSASDFEKNWPKQSFDNLLKQYPDLFIVVAGGNDGRQLSYGAACNIVPICNSAPNMVKVGAAGFDGSNLGPVIDLRVLGKVYVWRMFRFTTYREIAYRLSERWTTSFAAPVVAALAAVIWEQRPSLNPSELKSLLLLFQKDQGLDLSSALQTVSNLPR